ncbi:CU044_5270 family protein [Streptomyces sp. NPDC002588]|uniref:CU044_5270 family protein n=1 Tax=Streptomyces sp. NPDC002588 TaxID=3154419 RepID=UPI00331F35A5
MNPNPTAGAEQEGHDELGELAELARLLPAGSLGTGLPSGRHSQHKDVLMQLIDRDSGRGGENSRSMPRVRRYLRPALVVGAAAVAVSLAVGVTVGVGTGDGGTAARGGASGTPTGGSPSAAVTLDRIAAVAMRTDVAAVQDGQWVYVRTRSVDNEADWGQPVKHSAPQDREVWFSQEPGPLIKYGLIRDENGDSPIRILVPKGSPGERAGIDRPTYAWLASLPTDPDALLKRLYAETPVSDGDDKDQAVFERIGELVQEQILPSATASAIYRATARIPGVAEVDDAVDAVGRRGIAIARTNTAMGLRTEWIFDPETLGYLGERSVLTRDSAMGEAGTVFDTRAVLERAVVDKQGEEPGGRRRTERS